MRVAARTQFHDEFEKELFISPTLDKSNLFMIYKNLNKRINILYSRRLILSLLKIGFNSENQKDLELFIDSISKEDLYIIIKLSVKKTKSLLSNWITEVIL